MARKKKKQRSKPAKKLTLQQRAERAKSALDHGHYKKAIVHLRQLLKDDPTEEWQQWTATAHVKLANQLSQNNQHNEVITLYESGHKLCNLSLYDTVYINALLREKHYKKLLAFYVGLADKVDKAELFKLRTELAAVALAGEQQIIEELPDTDPVVADYDNALQLLTDYCNANDNAVATGLKSLSFRSPYRDLRQIIAAAIVLDNDVDKCKELLAKIPEESAFMAIATPIKLISEGTEHLLPALFSLPAASQHLIKEIKGWSKEPLLKKLSTLVAEPDFSTLFRIADSCTAVEPDFFYDCAKTASLHGFSANSRAITPARFYQRFNKPAPTDVAHMEALTALLSLEAEKIGGFDLYDYLDEMEDSWLDYLHLLDKKHKDTSLITALVCRYIVSAWDQYRDRITDDHVALLELSLQHDPQDKDTHLKLLRHYLDHKKLKQARNGLTLALKHYPEDLPLLLLAIEVAIAGGAHKKAANHAQTILAVDPINRQAQALLCNAHLSHARKLIKSGKWHLVDKELQEAQRWANKAAVMLSIIAIHRAIMALTNQQKSLAVEELQKLSSLIPDSFSASLVLRLESQATDKNAKSLHKLAKLKWIPARKQSKEALFSFIQLCKACDKVYAPSAINQVVGEFKSTLKTIIKTDISTEEYVRICDFWHQMEQQQLLEGFAHAAMKKYGTTPLMTYYLYVFDIRLSARGYDDVSRAIDVAHEQGDAATASRLIALLKKAPAPAFPFGPFADNDLDDIFNLGLDDEDDDLDDIFNLSLDDEDGFMAVDDLTIDLIREGDIGEMLPMLSALFDMPLNDLIPLHKAMGDELLRTLFLALAEGRSPLSFIDDLEAAKPKASARKKTSKKKPKLKKHADNKTGQMDLFGDDY